MWALCIGVCMASVLGSLHCVGMCGGFVAMYAGDVNVNESQRMHWAHMSYSMGRWLAYVSLGATVGAVGAVLDLAGRAAGLQRMATWIGGSFLLIWGIAMLVQHHTSWRWSKRLPLPLQRWLLGMHRRVYDKPPVAKGFVLGLMSGCLPCGWLYAFVLTAAATGSPWYGAVVMTAFWVGTLPAMLGVGFGLRWLRLKIGHLLPTLSALSIVVIGLLSLFFRAELNASSLAQRAASMSTQHRDANAMQRLRSIRAKRKAGHCACRKKPPARRVK